MRLKKDIEKERLKPLVVMDLVPLCSAQYERLFGTTRIPGVETGEAYPHTPHTFTPSPGLQPSHTFTPLTPSHTITHPLTPSHTLSHHHTPSHTITHPLTPSHTLSHHHTPSHTITHPLTPSHNHTTHTTNSLLLYMYLYHLITHIISTLTPISPCSCTYCHTSHPHMHPHTLTPSQTNWSRWLPMSVSTVQ